MELTLHQKRQFLVDKFCKTPPNWVRDYPNAKILVDAYGFDVFNSLELSFKLNTLSWFYTDAGKELLEKE